MKRTKCKKMRKIRILAILVLLFRYGSEFLKEGDLQICDTIYNFIIRYIYEGVLGIAIQPVCEGLWNWKGYPLLYFFAGIPTVILVIALSFLIRFKEHTKTVGPEFDNPYHDRWNSKGTYKTANPPAYRRIWCWFKEKLINNNSCIGDQLEECAVLSIIYEKGTDFIEIQENMALIQEWRPQEIPALQMYYDEKEDAITIFVDDKLHRVLSRGESLSSEYMNVCFLQ